MTNTPSRRSRMTRTERAQRLYTARADEYTDGGFEPNEPEEAAYRPNEAAYEEAAYLPNEAEDEYADYTPNEEPAPQPAADYSAYYSREGAEQEGGVEPAFAPPPSMQQYAYEPQTPAADEPADEYGYAAGNVYRPRRVTWAEEEREDVLAESDLGYQVQEDAQPVRRNGRRALCIALIVLAVVLLLAGAAWLLRDTLADRLGVSLFEGLPTETPAAIVTPEPIKAYDAAPAAAVAPTARSAIARLSGTLEMENYTVTDQHIVTRNQRADGSYDFYLFTAEGRLLCYFEGLGAQDMIPQAFGGFYVNQSPWLVTAGGSALIRTADIEAAINQSVFLHPMYSGWAVVESEADGRANYVNASGQLMSTLWFSRTFPFTGEYTLAYVDTGSTADADDRYLLYVLGQDGGMTRWLAASHMQDAVAAVCGMAYMSDGTLYRLPDTAAPVGQSAEVTAYPDCDALVVRNPATGKYGLFVQGEQHYAFAYDSIRPLESDLAWTEKTLDGGSASLTLRTVSGGEYPLPLSYSFVLEKDGQTEYVALSASSAYPIRLDGEF